MIKKDSEIPETKENIHPLIYENNKKERITYSIPLIEPMTPNRELKKRGRKPKGLEEPLKLDTIDLIRRELQKQNFLKEKIKSIMEFDKKIVSSPAIYANKSENIRQIFLAYNILTNKSYDDILFECSFFDENFVENTAEKIPELEDKIQNASKNIEKLFNSMLFDRFHNRQKEFVNEKLKKNICPRAKRVTFSSINKNGQKTLKRGLNIKLRIKRTYPEHKNDPENGYILLRIYK